MSTFRIAVTGTESTGKTTLCEQLSLHYQCAYVQDISRDYIAALKRAYTYEDVLQIAANIIAAEDKALSYNPPLLISDNDLVNIEIWLQYYSWQIPQWLQDAITARKHHLYLLCNIDLPWIEDEQRANPNDREVLFQRFIQEFGIIGVNYQLISGNYAQRLQAAVNHIDFMVRK